MQAAAGAAPEQATGAEAQAAPVEGEPQPSSWAPICPAVVFALDVFGMPNWKLKPEEKTALQECLAPVLDDLFPGGLGSERWAPYFRLLAVCGGIVLVRFDPEKGLPPLHAEDDSEAKDAAVQAEA